MSITCLTPRGQWVEKMMTAYYQLQANRWKSVETKNRCFKIRKLNMLNHFKVTGGSQKIIIKASTLS